MLDAVSMPFGLCGAVLLSSLRFLHGVRDGGGVAAFCVVNVHRSEPLATVHVARQDEPALAAARRV